MGEIVNEYMLVYIYDEAGSPIGLKYREPSYAEGVYDCYFFEKNLQGDIISIFDTTGFKIGAYNYDAWGNFTIDSAASGIEREIVYEINPFRYRGYYYDTETGWYYLQSRYYNPEWGRFLNADGQLNGDILGCNQFSYCGNNPVIRTDFSGKVWGWALACTIFGGFIGGASKIISNTLAGKPCNEGVLGAIAGGATYGFILSTTQDIALAGYMSATVESAVNELAAYSPKTADLNGMEYKETDQNSVAESMGNIVTDTIVNGTINTFTGYLAACFIPGSGEIPKGLYECLFSEAVVTSHLQTIVQGGITVIFNVYAEYQTSKSKESNNGYYYRQKMPISH